MNIERMIFELRSTPDDNEYAEFHQRVADMLETLYPWASHYWRIKRMVEQWEGWGQTQLGGFGKMVELEEDYDDE